LKAKTAFPLAKSCSAFLLTIVTRPLAKTPESCISLKRLKTWIQSGSV